MINKLLPDAGWVSIADEVYQPSVQFDFAGPVRGVCPIAAEHDKNVLCQAVPDLSREFVT